MERYHVKIGFPVEDNQKLIALTDYFNAVNWQYTAHCLDNLKYRVIDLEKALLFIKGSILNNNDIFEYYIEAGKIVKVCYRIKYEKNLDLILVLNEFKEIITIYLNTADDLHFTLKKELYNIPLTK